MYTPRGCRWSVVALIAAAVVVAVSSHASLTAQSAAPAPAPVTFSKDIAPILQRACQNCHRPGSIGPMSLVTFQEARPWARAIRQRTSARTMPPWFVEKTHGIQAFKDDPSLTEKEIDTIGRWVDAGAPEGNPADLPPPLRFDDVHAWRIGTPDLIVTTPEYVVKPQSPDQWVDFFVDSGLTEDRYVKAVQLLPSKEGFPVVHHASQYLVAPGDEGAMESFSRGTAILNNYTVGKGAEFMPPDTGLLIKAGTKIHFNMHYSSLGREIRDRSSLGLVLYPKGVVPKHEFRTAVFGRGSYDIDIPAGATDVRTDGYTPFRTAVKLINFNPHMHNRGKRQCIEVIYPDGRQQMLNCAKVMFGWAMVYNYADDATPLIPAGSMLHVINWHDNTRATPSNPDPRNWSGWGNRTVDEMNLSWISYYALTEAEYRQELAARRAATRGVTN